MDGKILVGGLYTTLDGQTRDHLARLNNTEPATQHLSHNGSTVTWLRGGASPEVWQASFDVCANGLHWAPLGPAARISGGWQLTNTSIPASATLRARAYVRGGQNIGTTWFIETMAGPAQGMFLNIATGTSLPALVVSGELGRQYELQSAPVLGSPDAWSLLASFILTNNPQTLHDQSATTAPPRFYRLETAP
jgi:hypothetical protein